MAVNKVEIMRNGTPETLIDLTEDTVIPETLAKGVTAHDAAGNPITGTMRTVDELLENVTLDDTLLWDGDTEGKTVFDMLGDGTYMYYLVSETVPSLSDLSNGVTITMFNPSSSETEEVTVNNFVNNHDVLVSQSNSSVIFATIDNVGFFGNTIPKKGVYFMCSDTYGYVSKIKIPEYTGFDSTIEVIKDEYIPEHSHAWDDISDKQSVIDAVIAALPVYNGEER